MKNLAPVFVMLIILMAFISALSAQTRIYNPDLPKHLVFQWRIETSTVHSAWKNSDFTITRDGDQMVVFYGSYTSLESAISEMPTLPQHVKANAMKLVPFFNQRSIGSEDALALMGNMNSYDESGMTPEDAVSFTVYFGTFENILSEEEIEGIDLELSFEVQANHTLAYSAGTFNTLVEAENYMQHLFASGFERAEVNKFLNGEKIASIDIDELYAFVSWNK